CWRRAPDKYERLFVGNLYRQLRRHEQLHHAQFGRYGNGVVWWHLERDDNPRRGFGGRVRQGFQRRRKQQRSADRVVGRRLAFRRDHQWRRGDRLVGRRYGREQHQHRRFAYRVAWRQRE